MSGEIGVVVALPILIGGAAVAVGVGAVGLVGYGVFKGIQKLMEPDRMRPLETPADLRSRIDVIRDQAARDLQKRIAPIEERQLQQERNIQELRSEVGRVELEMQRQLRTQQDAFFDRLREQRGEYLTLIREQDQRMAERVQTERRDRQKAIDGLQTQVNTILTDAQQKQDMAQSFVVDLLKVVDGASLLPHRRFAPGEIEKVVRQVNDARRNLDAGMADAALSTAQQAYWNAVDLRSLVLRKEQEYLLLYQAALEVGQSLLAKCQGNRKYIIDLTEEGEEREEYELDVDHWSCGELQGLEGQVEALFTRLQRESETLCIEEVRTILEQITSLEDKVPQAVDHARQNLIASQIRVNLAEMALDALQPQGFDLVDASYEGNDERDAYVVKVRNIAGGEVVAVISPVEGEFGKNSIKIHSYDETFVDEATIQQRTQEIVSVLQEAGIQTSAPQCLGPAHPEYQDIDKVRTRLVTKSGQEVRRHG
jgi:hypothetical protein